MCSLEERYEYIIAIGTSTGGPKALEKVITALPKVLPATYVIVQHMPSGFTKSLADRLDGLAEIEVREAQDGEVLRKGVAYIAPGGKQFRIINSLRPEIAISEEEHYKGHRPSVNVMLNSLVDLNTTKKMIGIIMTGMGSDGTEGIANLKEKVKIKVIVESESSCVVYGMPKSIVNLGLHDYEVRVDEIVRTIKKIIGG